MHQALVSESTYAYDLIIIGGGPAGVLSATTATAGTMVRQPATSVARVS